MDTKIEWKHIFDAPPVWRYDAQEAGHGDKIHAVIEGQGDWKWCVGFYNETYARMMGDAPTRAIAMRDCEDRIRWLRQEALATQSTDDHVWQQLRADNYRTTLQEVAAELRAIQDAANEGRETGDVLALLTKVNRALGERD